MIFPEFDPVAAHIGVLSVRWYGLMYLVGFVSAWLLGRYRASRPHSPVNPVQMDDLLFYGALGVILGGRIGYTLFYDFSGWMSDPLQLFRLWEGGMSFHGGFLGVLVAIWWYGRRTGRQFFQLTDFVAPLVPIGLFAGRIGNFINGELWGAPTDMPWGMQLDCRLHIGECVGKLGLPADTMLSPPLHPSQLYEALLEGIVLFVLLWLYSGRARPLMSVSALFLMGYGVFRFLVEFVRLPDAHIGYMAFDWLTMGQLLSLPMVALGLWLFVLAHRR